jgi:hypothetical protein
VFIAWVYLCVYLSAGYTVPTDIPYTQLLIRVAAEATIDDREDIINGLRPFFPSDNVYVSNTLKLLEAAETSTQMLSLFLTIVGVIAMVLCFFILWLSFTANVQENTWEFGMCGFKSKWMSNCVCICECM